MLPTVSEPDPRCFANLVPLGSGPNTEAQGDEPSGTIPAALWFCNALLARTSRVKGCPDSVLPESIPFTGCQEASTGMAPG